jgi:hypothetical protein
MDLFSEEVKALKKTLEYKTTENDDLVKEMETWKI